MPCFSSFNLVFMNALTFLSDVSFAWSSNQTNETSFKQVSALNEQTANRQRRRHASTRIHSIMQQSLSRQPSYILNLLSERCFKIPRLLGIYHIHLETSSQWHPPVIYPASPYYKTSAAEHSEWPSPTEPNDSLETLNSHHTCLLICTRSLLSLVQLWPSILPSARHTHAMGL